MWKLIITTLILSVSCQDVYRFNRPPTKDVEEPVYCDKDKTYKCQVSETCCPTGLDDPNKFRCCDLDKARCCKSGNSCCPESYICSNTSDMCYPNMFIILLQRKIASLRSHNTRIVHEYQANLNSKPINFKKITCSDGDSQCDDGKTCCPLTNGKYVCCPSPNAVCCSDYLHCCPHNTVCNITAGTCSNETISIPSISHSKRPSLIKPGVKSVSCIDELSDCEKDQTCCLLPDHSYGCCPFSNAVCCSDRVQCCPHDTVCNIDARTCEQNSSATSLSQLKASFHRVQYMCPDQTMCQNDHTCCISNEGSYGCCPSPNAICCSDNLHCCPDNTVCDITAGSCVHQGSSFTSILQSKIPLQAKSVLCPDSKTRCSEYETCCSNLEGGYDCCPSSNAVCCSDRMHCCPHNSICNVTAQKCDHIPSVAPVTSILQSKVSFHRRKLVMCPDGKTQCDDDETCCASIEGGYGCCPSSNAVCCSDGIHCCPHNSTCNITAQKCDHNPSILSVVSVKSILQSKVSFHRRKSVMCPDGKTQCDDDETCCASIEGGYGCCPFTSAVCCSDHLCCCPYNTVCNITAGTCGRQSTSVVSLLQPKVLALGVQSVVCPDSQSRCDDGQTCCASFDGTFGCCPDPNAVCCSDHIHCCPQGSTCNVNPATCG